MPGVKLQAKDLILPYFVIEGKNKKEAIRNFPDVFRFSVDRLIKDIAESRKRGLDKFLLFGIPQKKDAQGSPAYAEDAIVVEAVRKIKKEFPDLVVMTDVCLCAYTTHGHCGVLREQRTEYRVQKGRKNLSFVLCHPSSDFIDQEATREALAKMALSHAAAGADWVAPSAMAKKQVLAIRSALDKNGFKKTKILGYSAKFTSNFYGPFREAANSAPKFGDRTSYQLGYGDAKKALEEIAEDIKEGADMVMVKPALSYLDIVSEARRRSSFPLAAYNVSGEYAMVKAGARLGLWDKKKMVFEILTSIKRAGADHIVTYHAKDVAQWLKKR